MGNIAYCDTSRQNKNTQRCLPFITLRDAIPVMKTLGARIREARKKAGLTQKELSLRCGWGEANSRISGYEGDTREPQLADLQTIADVTGVKLSALLGVEPAQEGDKTHQSAAAFASITIPITKALTPAADGITVAAEPCDQGVVMLPAVSSKDYAAVITTSGLLPRIERDQVAVIAPTLPVLEGDIVLISMASGDLLLCRWLYDRGDVRYVEPINGGDRRELQRSAIRDCHYVAQVLNKPRQLAH